MNGILLPGGVSSLPADFNNHICKVLQEYRNSKHHADGWWMEALENRRLSESRGRADSDGDFVGHDSGIEAQGSESLIPPHWSHRRYESYASVENAKPPPITLEDHTEGLFEQSDSVWAKEVIIEDYVLVTGSVPNVGNFTVYNCKIYMINVSLYSFTSDPDAHI